MPLLLACFFVSGASGLVYEVIWFRWLVHVLGATTLATGTILAAFMGGLALGSWAAGRRLPWVARPLAAYGWMEVAVGLYALVLPPLLHAVAPGLRALGTPDEASLLAVSLGRFGLASLLLVPPTACMGATFPFLAAVLTPAGTPARGVGVLYAVNTAGAVLGTAAAGFVLLPALGASTTNRLAAAANLAVGLLALGLARLRPGGQAEAPGSLPTPEGPGGLAVRQRGAALLTAGLSGALAMAYEVAWSRALALVLGSSVYAFALMLTTFLVGIAAGSALAARRADRQTDPALALALVQLAMGLCAFTGLAAVGELPYLFLRLYAWSGGRPGWLLPLQFLITGASILGPALASGAVFPLVLALRRAAGTPGPGGWGRAAGTVYAANTLGAILGAFLAGFVLVPAAGIRGTLLVAILGNLGAAFGLLVGASRGGPTRWLAAPVPVAALVVPLLAPDWKPLMMASGAAVYAPRYQRLTRGEFRAQRQQARLLWYREGLTTTVSVEQQDGHLALRVNGKTDASTGADMPTQVLLGHLPLLLHPAPRDVLVIGLGSGVTAGSALRHPLRRLTVVEIERAVVSASRFFDPVSGRPLDDPRTRLLINDARSFLHLTRDRFDAIVSEPSNPWMSGAASLFTREFFELGRERLRPGGVFGQWVQLYGLTPALLRTLLATFVAVFPFTIAFQTTGGDLLLVGSLAPPAPELGALQARAAAVADDLRRVGIADLLDLLVRLRLDVEDLARFAGGAPVNTDDNGLVEYQAPRALYVDAGEENLQHLADAFSGQGTLLAALTRTAPAAFRVQLAERFLSAERPEQAEALCRAALAASPPPELRVALLRTAARAARDRGEGEEAERRWRAALGADPKDPESRLDLAAYLAAEGRAEEARRLLPAPAPRAPGALLVRHAELLLQLGRPQDAEVLLQAATEETPGAPLTRGRVRLALGDPAGAERWLRQALAAQDDARARAALAAALEQLARADEAREERWRTSRLEEAEGRRLERRASVLARLGHLRWAAYQLDRAAALLPGSLAVQEERARLRARLGDRRGAIAVWEETLRRFPGRPAPLLEIATLWEAEGEAGRARDALTRYLAKERDPLLRLHAEQRLAAVGSGSRGNP